MTKLAMSVETITDQDFETLLNNKDKVVVKYFANWCGSCKLFAPKFKRLSGDERFEDVHFIEVNAEENEIARRAAGVNNLPFFAVFKGGKLLDGKSTTKEDAVVEMITKLN